MTARGAGRLLRRIHDIPAEGLPVRSVADTLRAARRAGEVLRTVDPAVEARVQRLLGRLERDAPGVVAEVTSHGDFKSGELIRHDGDLAVVSVDDACRSAAARDLATYAADAATREDVDPAQVLDALIDGYGATPEAIRWHLSALLVRRAERPFGTLQEDWPARVEEIVGAAEKALD
jgi:Ser/Thr protein kinase RdoA (MazF antagonist)